MSSPSENSFGARLRRAQDLLTFISAFPGYNPPRPQESITGYTTLLNSIVAANTDETSLQQNYKFAVDARQAAFIKTPASVDKLLTLIRGAVEAQYGKNSTEAVSIAAIIKTMRASKPAQLQSDPNAPTTPKPVSQSERSFGSTTQYFNNLINTLTQFPAYNPTNNTIGIAALQANAAQLTTLNNAVTSKIQILTTARVNRFNSYSALNESALRIKSYVKAQYGIHSVEYILIKGMKI